MTTGLSARGVTRLFRGGAGVREIDLEYGPARYTPWWG